MEFFFLVKDIWEVGGKCGRRVKRTEKWSMSLVESVFQEEKSRLGLQKRGTIAE